MSISEATRRALSRYPYLELYMGMGVVNWRGLARMIMEDVAKELGAKPNIQSVVTALRRSGMSRRKAERSRLESILSKSSVNLRYDMGAVTVALGREAARAMGKLLREGTYILLQGMETVTIVAEEALISRIRRLLASEVLEARSELAIIVVKSPREITGTPGVIARLANILALERINVVELMSSHTETAFIVEEDDALRTLKVLRREIRSSRERLMEEP